MMSHFFHSSASAVHVMSCLFCVWLFSSCIPAGFHMNGSVDLEPYVPVEIDEPVKDTGAFEFTYQETPDPLLEPVDTAQEMTLSVEQTVMLALAHNQDLKTRQLNPVIAGAFEQMEKDNMTGTVRSDRCLQTSRQQQRFRGPGR